MRYPEITFFWKKINDLVYMKKSNQKKIRWFVREIDNGEKSVYNSIAKIMNITPQWIREACGTYHGTKQHPYPQKPGRKPKSISDEERRIIIETRNEYPISEAVALGEILDEKGIHVPHNGTHRIPKEKRFAKDEPVNKDSINGYATDDGIATVFGMLTDSKNKRIKSSFFEDDASRFITGYGVFSSTTSKNSVSILKEAIHNYGISFSFNL